MAPQERIVMHVDFDYFFAQCEEIRRPEIKQSPVLVCVFSGRTEDSGVISTANYVARKFGVKSGMPIKIAKAKLSTSNDVIFLPLDIRFYRQLSEMAMAIISKYADIFEQRGIDECFIEVSHRANHNFNFASELAQLIKQEIKQRTKISCSVGIAPNKMLAKIASDYKKPDGLTVIEPGNALKFISALNVDVIPGIGPKSRKRLEELGVITVKQLASMDLFKLTKEFGKKHGTHMYNAARARDDIGGEVTESGSDHKQIARIVTLKKDAYKAAEMYEILEDVCSHVCKRADEMKVSFGSVGIMLILDDLSSIARSRTLRNRMTSAPDILFLNAKSMLEEAMAEERKEGKRAIVVRRLGVRISDLTGREGQGTLFDFM